MARQLKPRTRAGNTMTEAEFWSFIRSALRMKSRWWAPITHTKLAARRNSKSKTNKKLKYEYQCAICKDWYPEKEIEVDHILPAGTLTCGDDLKSFVERLFCEGDGLRVLCEDCHHTVTQEQRKNAKI